MASQAATAAASRRAARSTARAVGVALRPRQWTKNLFVLAGIVFAAELGDTGRWLDALVALAAYCAASSAGYLVNDVHDAPADRLHARKRWRPVAGGQLGERTALLLAAALAAGALAAAGTLGAASTLFLVAFLALQLAYTLTLKALVALDVLAIAALFVLRAGAGAVAVDVPISPWLLACTALLALLLGLAKRRAELVATASEPARTRPVLRAYSVDAVDRALYALAAATIAAYMAYTLAHSAAMIVTVPFVAFGVGRYLLLVHRRDLGEEPEELVLRDVPLAAAVVLWAVVCSVVLALS